MHTPSMALMADFRDKYLSNMKGCRVLDVGACTYHNQPSYRELFTDYEYTGMDVTPGPNVDVVGYAATSPPYDVVISGQMLEHIARPWEWFQQIRHYFTRYLCVIAPNRYGQHRMPIDTFRYFPDGMRALFEYANIPVIEVIKVGIDTRGIGGV